MSANHSPGSLFLVFFFLASLFRTQKFAHGKEERNTHCVVIFEVLLRPIQKAYSARIVLGLGPKDGVVEGGVDVIGLQVQAGEVGQGSVKGAGEKLEIWGLDYGIGW